MGDLICPARGQGDGRDGRRGIGPIYLSIYLSIYQCIYSASRGTTLNFFYQKVPSHIHIVGAYHDHLTLPCIRLVRSATLHPCRSRNAMWEDRRRKGWSVKDEHVKKCNSLPLLLSLSLSLSLSYTASWVMERFAPMTPFGPGAVNRVICSYLLETGEKEV